MHIKCIHVIAFISACSNQNSRIKMLIKHIFSVIDFMALNKRYNLLPYFALNLNIHVHSVYYTTGFTAANKCLNLFALLAYIFAVIAFIALIVCLALVIHTKRQMGQKQTRRTNAKGRWNNVTKKLKSKVSVKNKK